MSIDDTIESFEQVNKPANILNKFLERVHGQQGYGAVIRSAEEEATQQLVAFYRADTTYQGEQAPQEQQAEYRSEVKHRAGLIEQGMNNTVSREKFRGAFLRFYGAMNSKDASSINMEPLEQRRDHLRQVASKTAKELIEYVHAHNTRPLEHARTIYAAFQHHPDEIRDEDRAYFIQARIEVPTTSRPASKEEALAHIQTIKEDLAKVNQE